MTSKPDSLKEKKITITVPLGLLYILFGMFVSKLWLIWIHPSPFLCTLVSNCLFKWDASRSQAKRSCFLLFPSNHWPKNWWQKLSGRVWMLKTNQGRDLTWFMSKPTSSLRGATQKAAVLQGADFSASQHQAFCSMNPWKSRGGFPSSS